MQQRYSRIRVALTLRNCVEYVSIGSNSISQIVDVAEQVNTVCILNDHACVMLQSAHCIVQKIGIIVEQVAKFENITIGRLFEFDQQTRIILVQRNWVRCHSLHGQTADDEEVQEFEYNHRQAISACEVFGNHLLVCSSRLGWSLTGTTTVHSATLLNMNDMSTPVFDYCTENTILHASVANDHIFIAEQCNNECKIAMHKLCNRNMNPVACFSMDSIQWISHGLMLCKNTLHWICNHGQSCTMDTNMARNLKALVALDDVNQQLVFDMHHSLVCCAWEANNISILQQYTKLDPCATLVYAAHVRSWCTPISRSNFADVLFSYQ